MKDFRQHIWRVLTVGSTLLAYEAYNSRLKGKGQYIITRQQLEELSKQQQVLLESNKDIKQSLNTLQNDVTNIDQKVEAMDKLIEEINKIISNRDNFLPDLNINQLIETYKEFLSTLTIEQICMVINITTSLFILGCVTSILFAYLGTYIVDKLKLDVKFPKLASIIRLRVKFQNFYILTNLLLIVLSLFFIIYINFTTLSL